MRNTPEQYNRLIKYLDNLLTPEEEAAFIEELNENEDLQREFDFELILRESFKEEYAITQSANNTSEHAIEQRPAEFTVPAGKSTKVVRLWPYYKKIIAIAAMLITIAAAGLVFYFISKNEKNIAVFKYPGEKDSASRQKDSGIIRQPLNPGNNNGVALADNLTPDRAFKKYYSRYRGSDNDPVTVSRYFTAYYYDKNYKEVLGAGQANYQTKGAADSLPYLYVEFYKSLSLIETDKAGKGAIQLNKLLNRTGTHQHLYYLVQWYLAMAYLKNNDVAGAKNILTEISVHKNPSPYKSKAGQLLKELG